MSFTPPNQLCDKRQLSHSLKKWKHGLLMNLLVLNNVKTDQQVPTLSATQEQKLKGVFQKFEKVFSVPKTMPPKTAEDYQMPLKKGTLPVAVKPCGYL